MSKKIIIIGNSCSGKSTLGEKLSEQIHYPWFDLDEYHWLPNWIERPDEEMRDNIKKDILSQEKWVVSGNYTHIVKDLLWTEADTIIWLNYPLTTILSRFFKRTYRRIVLKEPCCNGNQETFSAVFLHHDGLLYWVIGTHYSKIRKYRAWKNGPFQTKRWIELTQPHQTATLVPLLLDSTDTLTNLDTDS